VRTGSGPVAVEVELQRKTFARLHGILGLYGELTEADGPLAGVIYICDRADVTDLITRAADDVGLVAPALSMRTFRTVLDQAYAAAAAAKTSPQGA